MNLPWISRKKYDALLARIENENGYRARLLSENALLWDFINKNHSNPDQPRDKKGRWKKPVVSEF